MTSTVADILGQLNQLLEDLCASPDMDRQFDGASTADLVTVLLTAGRLQRRIDAVVTTAAGAVAQRDTGTDTDRVSAAAGCGDLTELLRRTLRVDVGTARRYGTAGRRTHRAVQLSSGETLPARFEALGQALRDGELSLTGFLAATGPLAAAASRIGREDLCRADRLLADAARGMDFADESGSPGPAPSTDELAALAHHIVWRLDPDGKEPEDERANRNRGLTLGRIREGLVPIRGALLPDAAGQLQRLLDTLLNPKVDEPDEPPRPGFRGVSFAETDPNLDGLPDPETRTPAQKRHDAFAAILNTAAGSGSFPTVGGAAPTLVVSISADDYIKSAGRATVEGTGWDVPFSVAQHAACAGGVQRVVFDRHGQIVSIGTSARIFNALQRRAIVLRDRECVIPGCHIPATWCEIHHVLEHAQGGPTHTSNGVALCWFHHRNLGTSGWQVRMRQGTPEIRGPAWWDPLRAWRRPRLRAGTDRFLADTLGPPGR